VTNDPKTDKELRKSQSILGLQEETAPTTVGQEEARIVQWAPAKEPTTPREWIQQNLFSSPFNSALTIIFGGFALFMAVRTVLFLFVTGEWSVFQGNARSYMVGRWPLEQLWRVWVALYAVSLLGGLTRGMSAIPVALSTRRRIVFGLLGAFALFVIWYVTSTWFVRILIAGAPAFVILGFILGRRFGPRLSRPLLFAWIFAFPVIMVLFRGFNGVPPRLWGGFILNVIVASVAIFASFPIGLLLALGRRSTLPAIRIFCVGFIELIRGAPLYVLLISGAFLLPLLMPPGLSDVPLIIRAMIIFTLFSSVYVAEIVRGGLQGVHEGQYEASKALGLPVTRMMALVILPQALRATIPAMISHMISLWKDTSLLAVISVKPVTRWRRSFRLLLCSSSLRSRWRAGPSDSKLGWGLASDDL
jgi:general L-amino acid transport system permease protein